MPTCARSVCSSRSKISLGGGWPGPRSNTTHSGVRVLFHSGPCCCARCTSLPSAYTAMVPSVLMRAAYSASGPVLRGRSRADRRSQVVRVRSGDERA